MTLSMPGARRIGILQTANGDVEFARSFPSDGENVGAQLTSLRPQWEIDVIPVTEGVFPPSVYAHDAYVITGSPASVHDALPWIKQLGVFIRELHTARVPTVGLCFGHQAIAAALGATVGRNQDGWALGVASTHFECHERWMDPPQDAVVLYAAHNEQVTALPSEARQLGGNAFCPVGSFAVGDHFFTTQYHPEFSEAFMQGLVGHVSTTVDASVIDTARQQLRQTVDAHIFVRWIVQFLEVERPFRSGQYRG